MPEQSALKGARSILKRRRRSNSPSLFDIYEGIIFRKKRDKKIRRNDPERIPEPIQTF